MAAPTLKIQALVDFVLKANKISDTAIIAQLKASLGKLGEFKLPITPVLDSRALKKATGKTGVIGQIDQQIANVEGRLDNFGEKFIDTAKTAALAADKAYGGETEAGQRREATAKRLAALGERELATQRKLLRLTKTNEEALRSFAKSDVGSRLPDTLKNIEKLRLDSGYASKLEAQARSDVRATSAFMKQHADRLGQIESAAKTLRGTAAGAKVGDSEDRGKVPTVPITVPGLTNEAKALREASNAAAAAVTDKAVKKAAEANQRLESSQKKVTESLDGTRKAQQSLSYLLRSQGGDTPFLDKFRKKTEEIGKQISANRAALKETGKVGDTGARAAAAETLQRKVIAGEKAIAQLRVDAESRIAVERNKNIGQTYRGLKSLTETTETQAQRDLGRKFLKGFSSTKEAIPQIGTAAEGRNVVEAIKSDFREAATAASDFSRTMDKADRGAQTRYGNLQKAVEARRSELREAVNQVTRLERGDSGRPTAFKEARLDLDYTDQVKKLAEARNAVSDIDKQLKESKLPATAKEALERQSEAYKKNVTRLQSALAEGAGVGDFAQRKGFLDVHKKSVAEFGAQVKKTARDTPGELAKIQKSLGEATKQRQIDAGKQVIADVGGPANLGNVRNINDLSNAVTALDAEHVKAKQSLTDYDNAVSAKTKKSSEEFKDLSADVARTGTTVKNAQDALNKLRTAETQADKDRRAKGVDTTGEKIVKDLDSATKSTKTLATTLNKLKTLPGVVAAQDEVQKLQKRIDSLRETARATPEGTLDQREATRADQARQVDALQRQLSDLSQKTTSQQTQDIGEQSRASREAHAADLERIRSAERGAALERRIGERGARRGVPTPPLVLAAQVSAGAAQPDLTAHLDQVSKDLFDAEKKRLDLVKRSGETEDTRQQRRRHEQRAAEIETARAVQQARGFVPSTESAAPRIESFTPAQIAAARSAYGIDLENIDQIRRGTQARIEETGERLKANTARRAAIEERLTKSGAKLDGEYQKLTREYADVSAGHTRLKESAARLTQASGALVNATSERTLQELASARYTEGNRIIKEAGGSKALAGSLRGIKGEDRTQLPLVRDTLQQNLGLARASRDNLITEGKRGSDEFKKVTKEAGHLQKAVRRVNDELVGYTKLTSQVGGLFRQFARYGLGYAALYQLLAGVRALVTGVTQLDSALVSIKAITQSTNAEMLTIEGSIKRVATQTRFTTAEIANAGQVLAQAGVTPDQFPTALAATANFAAATESSIELSADLLSTMRNVFTELGDLDIANQLTRAVNISKLTAADLKTILSLSAQTAKAYNLTSDQYLAAVTTLRNAGIKASTVATGLRQALIEIFSPDSKSLKVLGKRYAQLGENRSGEEISSRFFKFQQTENPAISVLRELKRLGFTGTGRATFAGRTFDVRAENVIKGLITNLDEVVGSQAKIVFGNSAITASVEQMESLNNSVSNLGATITAVSHDLSQDLLPNVENFVDGITSVIAALGNFDAQLRATTGTGAGDAVTSGLLTGGLAASFTPSGLGFAKAAGRNIAAFGVGAGASGLAQNALKDSGFSTGLTKFLSDVAGVLATAFLFLRPQLKKVGVAAASAVGLAGPATVALAKTGELFRKISLRLSSLPAVAKLGDLGLKLPGLFKLLGLLTIAAGLAYRYFSGGDGRDTERRLKQARKNLTDATARNAAVQDQLKNLQPTGDGYVAGNDSLAGASEQLTTDLEEVDQGIANFFGATGEKAKEIKEVLRRLEAAAADEGVPLRGEILNSLAQSTGVAIDSSESREEVRRLQSLLANADATAKGLLENAQLEFKKFLEQREELTGTVRGETYEALLKAAADAGLSSELAGVLEATSEEVETLFRVWITEFNKAKSSIVEVQENARTAQEAFEVYREALFNDIESARSPEEVRTQATINQPPPTNDEEFQRRETLRANAVYRLLLAQKELRDEQVRVAELPPVTAVRPGLPQTDLPNKIGELTLKVENLIAALAGLEGQLEASRNESLRAGAEKREEVTVDLSKLQALRDAAQEGDKGAADLLRRFSEVDSYRQALEIVDRAIAEASGSLPVAAEQLAQNAAAEGDRARFVVKPNVLKLLEESSQGFESLEQRRRDDAAIPLTYASQPSARALQTELSDVDREIRSLQKARRFDELDDKLLDRKTLQLSLIDGELAFERQKRDDEPGKNKKKIAQGRIDSLIQRRLDAEERYDSDVEKANIEDLKLRERRLLIQLRALKIQAEAQLTDPDFVDFSGVKKLEDRFNGLLNELVDTIGVRGNLEGLTTLEVDDLQQAVLRGATSMREFARLYEKIISASQRYLDSVNRLLAEDSIFYDTDVDLSIVRKQRGIREPADKRLDLINKRLEASGEALVTRQRAANEAESRLAEFDRKGLTDEDARLELVIAVASARESLKAVRDDIVELRKDAQAVALDVGAALTEAFDLQGVMSDMRLNVETSIRTMADDIRGIFNEAFDGLARDFGETLVGMGDDTTSFRDRVKDTFENFFKGLGARIAETLFKKAIFNTIDFVAPSLTQPKANGDASTISQLLGLSDPSKAYDTVQVDGKTVIVNGLVQGLPAPESAVPTPGSPNALGFIGPLPASNVASPGFVGPVRPGNELSPDFIGPPRPVSLGNPASPEFVGPVRPAVDGAEEAAGGFFDNLKTGFSDTWDAVSGGLSKLGTSISGILSSVVDNLFGSGKGGQVAQIGLATAFARTGGIVSKFRNGGVIKAGRGADSVTLGSAVRRMHGGIIKGPGTPTSDSIPGVVVDAQGQPQRGILVSNDEAILNGAATEAMGAPFINWINENADRFASGGLISGSSQLQAAAGGVLASSKMTHSPSSSGNTPDLSGLADSIADSMQGATPQKLALEVDDGALNRTLGDYLERYFADVIASR